MTKARTRTQRDWDTYVTAMIAGFKGSTTGEFQRVYEPGTFDGPASGFVQGMRRYLFLRGYIAKGSFDDAGAARIRVVGVRTNVKELEKEAAKQKRIAIGKANLARVAERKRLAKAEKKAKKPNGHTKKANPDIFESWLKNEPVYVGGPPLASFAPKDAATAISIKTLIGTINGVARGLGEVSRQLVMLETEMGKTND